MLSRGYSVNLYMGHGGTTFGYMQGANSGGPNHYEPDTTSYDYDAPVAEDGKLTKKFWAFRSVFNRYLKSGEVLPAAPAENPHVAISSIHLNAVADLMRQLPKPIKADHPPGFEQLHHPYGTVAYSFRFKPSADGALQVKGLQDRAWFGAPGKFQERLDRATGLLQASLAGSGLPVGADRGWLVVESQGRVNFSREHKGLRSAPIEGFPATDWETYPLTSTIPSACTSHLPTRTTRRPAR